MQHHAIYPKSGFGRFDVNHYACTIPPRPAHLFLLGHLYLNSSLDYESQHAFALTVQASDGGTPSLSSTQTLTVLLMDVNDETPLFEQNLYRASVMENREPGEAVITVTAVDLDSGTVQEERNTIGKVEN